MLRLVGLTTGHDYVRFFHGPLLIQLEILHEMSICWPLLNLLQTGTIFEEVQKDHSDTAKIPLYPPTKSSYSYFSFRPQMSRNNYLAAAYYMHISQKTTVPFVSTCMLANLRTTPHPGSIILGQARVPGSQSTYRHSAVSLKLNC